jgi:hypothetical protein
LNKLLLVIPVIVIVALISVYVVLSQQVPSSNQGTPFTSGSPSPDSSAQNSVTTLKYKTVSFTDIQGIGTKAFSMLIPDGWQSSGDIQWILDNPAMPAFGSFKAWNPNGAEEYNYFANQAYFWSDNPMIKQTFPVGSRYFGAEVREPLSPTEALKQIVLPMHRSNAQNVVVKAEEQLPELGKLVQTGTDAATGTTTSAVGGKIRVEYTLNGVVMEEEMYCLIQTLTIPIPTYTGMYQNINWYLTYLQSFRAEKGQLDSHTRLFQTISYSAKTDPNWLNKYDQVVNYLIQKQIQQIQSLGQLSSIISQTSNEISDANYESWQRTQAINDQIATDFSNYIRGVQTYNNPIDGSTVDLPSGYSYAWGNSLGEFVLSDSAGFNPNIGSNLNWEQLSP